MFVWLVAHCAVWHYVGMAARDGEDEWLAQAINLLTNGPSRVDSDLTTAPMIRAAIVAHLDVGGRALSEQQSAIQQFLDAVLQTDSARQGNYVEDRGLEGGQFEKDVQAIRELLALNTYTDASDAAETYGITTEELYRRARAARKSSFDPIWKVGWRQALAATALGVDRRNLVGPDNSLKRRIGNTFVRLVREAIARDGAELPAAVGYFRSSPSGDGGFVPPEIPRSGAAPSGLSGRRVGYRVAIVAGILLLAVAVGGTAWLEMRASNRSSLASPSGTSSSDTAKTGVGASAKQSSPPVSEATMLPNSGCPTPDQAAARQILVTAQVLYWCTGAVLTEDGKTRGDQAQVKLRLKLTNVSDHVINISTENPSRIRLVVEGDAVDKKWSPRPKTAARGDRPVALRVDGYTYWAIPPNADYDEVGTPVGMFTGFASKWSNGVSLSPGESIGSGVLKDDSTDLVFQVPVELGANPRVLGVAVLDVSGSATNSAAWTIIGLCRFGSWGPQLAPSHF